jgi:hypothetical protein
MWRWPRLVRCLRIWRRRAFIDEGGLVSPDLTGDYGCSVAELYDLVGKSYFLVGFCSGCGLNCWTAVVYRSRWTGTLDTVRKWIPLLGTHLPVASL